ncbi:helix-turn-helix domain-containing protein [Ensifer sp. HO-A22]|uniref:Helix-turn-helix domain-containing protein n=1 Tax=Ensifer oleiphilus TaxID=2742698 RepID=A0A7Y6UNJ9_9HYPH|nr:helix-turn-helix domain-containing protein [Ensifer oleiphilus]NVD40501.1 helix-turn-helix domain-containing protein [Ensifer oleiphilus]
MSGRGAQRILELIEWLASRSDAVTLAQVVQALALPKSSTLLLLRTLVDAGYVTRQADGRYLLIRLPGEPSEANNGWGTILRVAEPILRETVAAVEETGFIAVLTDDRQVRYLNKILPRREIRYDRDIATPRIAHYVASGLMLLSGLSEDDFQAYLGCSLLEEDDPQAIAKRVTAAQKDGYVANLHGRVEGAAGVAAPIRDPEGRIVAVVNMSGPRERIAGNLDRVAQATVGAALRVSETLSQRMFKPGQPNGRD